MRLAGIGERGRRLRVRSLALSAVRRLRLCEPLIGEVAAEERLAAVAEGELHIAVLPLGGADFAARAGREDGGGRVFLARDLRRRERAPRDCRPCSERERHDQRCAQGQDGDETYFDLVHEKTPDRGERRRERFFEYLIYFTQKNAVRQAGLPAPDEKMQISPAFLAPCAQRAAHAGVTASATRKNFHGVSSAGGSERKRIRSLVTGWVKASEYAHSASLPLTAYSPP